MEPSSNTTETPQVSGQVPDQAPDSVPISMTPAKGSKKGLITAVVIVALIVILGGGYVFGLYLPNQPGNIYKAGLKNSAAAVDKLTTYATSPAVTERKGALFDGSFKLKSPSVSADATLTGAYDKDLNGDIKLKVDASGLKVAANALSIRADSSTTPDVYLQVSGVASLLNAQGLGSLGSLDGKWIKVDHTLLDSLAAKARQQAGAATSEDSTTLTAPTQAQLTDAINKVNAVNKQYLFSTNPSTAVLTGEKFVAKEQVNNRTQYHFNVGYSKDNLSAYVKAIGAALDSSKLNDWSKKVNDGKSLSEQMNVANMQKTISQSSDNPRFDIWIDAKSKLIGQLKFNDPKDPTAYIAIAQNYTGGSTYPFSLSFNGGEKESANGTVGFSIDTITGKVGVTVEGSSDKNNSVTFGLKLTVTPSDKAVKPEVPAGATSISDLLAQLGLSGMLGGGPSPALSPTPTKQPFSFDSYDGLDSNQFLQQ